MQIPALEEDFTLFLEIVWPEIGLTPHPAQIEFARFISTGHERIIAMSPRDFGKSNILAALVCWFLYKDPDDTIVVASATEKRAKDIVRQAKAMLKGCPLLAHMAPGRDDLDGELRFQVGNRKAKGTRDPSVAAYGLNAGMTGAHGNKVVCDDIEIPENSMTVEAREKIRERVRGFENICNIGGEILLVGTPQTLESIYYDLIEEGIYDLYRMPARVPDESASEKALLGLPGWLLDKMATGRLQPGDPTYPERMGHDWLLEQEIRQGRSRFMLQMMLDPSASDADKFPLKVSDLIVMDLPVDRGPFSVVHGRTEPAKEIRSPGLGTDQFYRPVYFTPPGEWIPYDASVMTIDPAGFGGDQVGYCVMKVLGGYGFILRAGGLEGGYSDQTLRRLLTLAQECEVRRIVVESNWADGIYGNRMASYAGMLGIKVAVEGIRVHGQKESRIIDILEPVMNAHRLIVDTRVASNYQLMHQLTHISRERGSLKNDDQIDAVSLAVTCLQGHLFRNAEQSVDDYKTAEFQAEMKKFQQMSGVKQHKQTPRLFSLRK